LGLPGAPAQAQGIRVKDITTVAGARDNQLYGLGLVVGLNRTGARSLATQQMAIDMLRKLETTTTIARLTLEDPVFWSHSISQVMVTADLPPFARKGARLDVTVSVMDDATSLQGGTLLLTPLRGADGEVYAVAQGSVSIGGLQSFFATPGQLQNHPTAGRIPAGAIVEREELGKVVERGCMRLLLRDPDFKTAKLIADAVNKKYSDSAFAIDAGSVQIRAPLNLSIDPASLISEVGLLEVTPDIPARVVINERTGTVVVGNHVRIAAVAIAHGNLVIRPASAAAEPATPATPAVPAAPTMDPGFPPSPYAGPYAGPYATPYAGPYATPYLSPFLGATPLPPNTVPQGDKLNPVAPTITVAELSQALNALGVTPKDLIAVFQALKASGALKADLVVM
jgi:flagellar P-ring protein precursor FlgI